MLSGKRARLWAGVATICLPGLTQAAEMYDLVVYGGTAGGVTAAIQASRMGKSVLLIEPTQHLGGMTTNGLSATDTGSTGSIQGIAREFYTRLGQHYGLTGPEWNFEPKVAELVLNNWAAEANVTVVRGERRDLNGGVSKQGNTITAIRMESGREFGASMFIDAGYEGDLMAKAGVNYTFGREANATYGETYNGVQTVRATKHQFGGNVSPYIIPGNPASGLLPGVSAEAPGADGSGDQRIQAYNFRLTVTQAASRRPWTAPEGYDAARYELLKRHIAANPGVTLGSLLSIRSIKGGKFDINNNGAVSTDHIGANYLYPDGDYATREAILQDHRGYQQGLLYFLATDPSVPSTIRNSMNSYGLTQDEFADNDGWSNQIYVREARRMVGPYVMTDKNVIFGLGVDDPIALGSYTMDSHNAQRYITASGFARNEGDIQTGVPRPYGISYRSITPFEEQAGNLLVTSALSASHIAYGSIRMEPVFMELGQAAATAAVLAMNQGISVQDVQYSTLRTELIADGALLDWPVNIVHKQMVVRDDFNDQATLPKVNMAGVTGGEGFADAWTGTGTEDILAGNLTSSVGGYAIEQVGTGLAGKVRGDYNDSRQNTRTISGSLAGEVWFSILLNNPDGTAHAGLSFNPTGNADPANDTVRNLIELAGNQLRLKVDNALDDQTVTLAIGQTHLIVGRIMAGIGLDKFDIWADPADLLNLGLPDITSTGSDWLAAVSKLGILSYNTAGPAFAANGGLIDALRLSNRPSWAYFDVTGVPEPVSLLLLGLLPAGLLRRTRRTAAT